jgi:cytochrome c551/c552
MLRSLKFLLAVVFLTSGAAFAQSVADTQAFVTKYCVTCHNPRLKTAGLTLDPSELAHVAGYAETWEKVIRKLRAGTMPPVGVPRPEQAAYDSAANFLESELDRAAASQPAPGKLPLLHRLSRTEYQNAVRDLLGLTALPKEMAYEMLLPPDNASSGFDNIADLLFVSPTSMERYLAAARKISRLAIGDPNIPEMVNIFPLGGDLPQDVRVDGLPFGTRGGLLFQSDLPLDGEYLFKLEFAGGGARESHEVEILVDGQRVWLSTVGGLPGRREGDLQARLPLKAGLHQIGVTFIQHDEARDELTVRPRGRGRGAQMALASVTLGGPYTPSGPGDTPSRRRILICKPANAAEESPCAKKILSTLARRAYRRPVKDTDLDELLPFYTAGRAEGSFEAGIQRSIERLLVSPQFLFRIERNLSTVAPGTSYRVNDIELASRLSFFLWSSIPDDELLDAAISGKVKTTAGLEHEVKRMLADPRSETMVTNFAEQWLYLRDIEAKKPDELLFPDYDENLRAAFRRETTLFLDSVLREKRPVLELLTANYSFLNERLARHYGIPNIKGSYFRRYEFPPNSTRGGLLGQGSILTLTAYSTRTSPVLRGKWIMENLLAAPPPPPPPNVPPLKTEKENKPLTMREAMIAHRASPVCASCHSKMDPIGFAMENFDAIGRWRDLDNGSAIDNSGGFPDGTKFVGMPGLKKALLARPEVFVNTVAEKLLMYAASRNIQYFDAPAVRAIVHESQKNSYTFESLVLGVVKSAPFQLRQAPVTRSARAQ